MPHLTVLSPHRDDAAFSLFLALSQWSRLPDIRLRVVNFFTISEYGPRAYSGALSISSVRQREDQRVLSRISRLATDDLNLLDAPIRLGIDPTSVFQSEIPSLDAEQEIHGLTCKIRKYFLRGIVLAPLALGDHIDHRLVRQASITASFSNKLGFYEDLPYAIWTSGDTLRSRVHACEEGTRSPLRPIILRNRAISLKRSAISGYQSQIAALDAKAIAQYALRHGGERIWAPKHSRPWRALLDSAHAP